MRKENHSLETGLGFKTAELLICDSLPLSTSASYKLNGMFAKFWSKLHRNSLKAKLIIFYAYRSFLFYKYTIKGTSIRPYFSCIGKQHRRLSLRYSMESIFVRASRS